AAVTERVRLGHLVLASGFRHPALLAKMAITLDHASGGRVELGLGSGSYAPEFAEFGLDFPKAAERAGRLAEAIEVIRLLFTEDAPSYDGRYYRLRAAPSRPRPVQRPHPPIHVRGAGEKRTLPLVARLGVQGVVFFLHDRAEPETLRLLADEVVPAARDL